MHDSKLYIFNTPLSSKQQDDFSHFLTFDPCLKIITEDCLDTTKYFTQNCHEDVARESSRLIDLIEKEYSFGGQKPVKNAYKKSIIFDIQFVIYHSMYCFKLIQEIINKENISSISLESSQVFGEYSEDVLACIQALCKKSKINLSILNRNKYSIFSAAMLYLNTLTNGLINMLLFYFSVFILKFKLLILRNKKFYLFNDDSYSSINFETVLFDHHELFPVYLMTAKKGYFQKLSYLFSSKSHCLFLPSQDIRLPLSHKINTDLDGLNFFSWEGIDFNIIVRNHLQTYSKDIENRLSSQIKRTQYFLNILKPVAIFSQQGHGISSALGELADDMGIKNYFISHGSHFYTDNIYANKIWRQHSKALIDSGFQHTIIQTKFELDFINNHDLNLSNFIETGPWIKCKPHKISSHSLDEDNMNLISFLYASSPKFGTGYRPIIYESYDEYIKNIDLFSSIISKQNDCKLTIRHRDTPLLSSNILEERFSQHANCYVSNSQNFVDVLHSSDCLVSYSSTCIEEAIIMGKIVILVDFQKKYNHLQRLEKIFSKEKLLYLENLPSYYYVTSAEDILSVLKEIRKRKTENTLHSLEKNQKTNYSRLIESIQH